MDKSEHYPYIAGFTDAEGCIRLALSKKTNRWAVNIDFGQTRPESISLIHQIFGGSLYIQEAIKDWSPKLCLRVSARDEVMTFLKAILPFAREKKAQLELAYDFLCKGDTRYEVGEQSNRLLKEAKQEIISIFEKNTISAPEQIQCSKCPAYADYKRLRLCKHHYFAYRYQAKREGAWRQESRVLPFGYVNIPSENDKKYIAGFFDGDGNVLVTANTLRVQFGQTRTESIAFIERFYGGSKTLIERKGPRRPIVFYKLCREAAVLTFLADVRPFLREKHKEVEHILSSWKKGDYRTYRTLLRKIRVARSKPKLTIPR